jgi:hypothetical protein
MNGPGRSQRDLDDLLKTVLRDDLPRDVEDWMRERIIAFGLSEKKRGRRRVGSGWLTLAFRKEALAFSSVAAIIVGGFMHLGGNRSALAESFTTLNVLFSVSAEIRAAGTMDGEADYRAADGTSLTYAIRWSSPETTRVEVRQAGAVVKILDISSEGLILADPLGKTEIRTGGPGQIEDPLIRPVMDVLSGEVLAERLNSRWRLIGREPLGGGEDLFHFSDRERGILVDLGVDPSTRRPATMRIFEPDSGPGLPDNRPVLSVRFHWTRPT